MKSFIRKNCSLENTIIFSMVLLIIISHTSFGSDLGTSLISTFENWMSFITKIARYIAAAAIIGAVFMAFSGRASWNVALIIIMGGIIIGNLDTILDKLGFTKGLVF